MSDKNWDHFFRLFEAEFPRAFERFSAAVNELTDKFNAFPVPPDPKFEARQRSREDLSRKRKELFKRRKP